MKKVKLLLLSALMLTCLSCGGGEKAEEGWQITDSVDEFGDAIEGESAVVGIFYGTMSNSAVTDAKLMVKCQIMEGGVYTIFYEYGNTQAHLPDNEFIKIKVKTESGEVKTIEQFLFRNLMTDTEKTLGSLLLSQSSPLKIVVDLSRFAIMGGAKYQFEIDPTGLKELLD